MDCILEANDAFQDGVSHENFVLMWSGRSVRLTRGSLPGIVGFHSRLILNSLVVLQELGSDMVDQVGRHMVECSRLKMPYPHEDLEVCDRQTVSSEVPATFFEPSL